MATSHQELSQSPQRTVIISVALVGVLGALATVFDYLHLKAAHQLTDYSRFSVIALSMFLPCMVALVLFSRGQYLRQAVWAVFLFGSIHLLTLIGQALFLHNDTAVAVEHGIWILVVEVCLFATLKRQTALVLSTILYSGLLAIIGTFLFLKADEAMHAFGEGELVQLLIGNAAILVLLGGLSSFREFALVESARAEASEDHAALLGASVEEANAARQKAMRALSSAEAAAKARESFLASMSHELRTPLNAIIGFAQILEMGDDGIANIPEKRKEYVTDIRHSGEHMLSLVTQILEFSQLESEVCDLHPEKLSVPEVATAAMRMVGVLADKKHVPLLSQWDGRYNFEIETDERALCQVLVNLLSNAVKFTHEGGLICVGVDFDKDGGVKIEIHDNGIGIPPEKLANVRDPFFQVNDQRTTGTEGTGLGLSIVTSLVRELGGEFDIESTVGEGTCCRVRLPLKMRTSASADSQEDEKLTSVASA
jgi:signal transduction histidine kinase